MCEGSSVHRKAAAVQDKATVVQGKEIGVQNRVVVVLGRGIVVQGKAAAVQGTPIPKIRRAGLGGAAVGVDCSLVLAVVAVRGKAKAAAAEASSKAPARVRYKAGMMEQVSRRTEVGLVDSSDPTWWILVDGISLGGRLIGPENVG